MSALDSGQRVGRYRIVRFLGAGAMGEVYLAEDPHIERRLAIKTVRLAGGRPADIEDRKRRLLREARAAGRLLHPNVVALFDAGEEEGLLYLAFEFVEGCDLASRLETGPPPSLREVLRIVRQVADALDYAHRQGIVHRDIKPSNILIDAAGHVKVADFGIAKVTGQNTELTVAGSVMGSPQYLSPEQIRGDELDGRSDIFSLGVVLYELLSGRRPFDGETITTLVYQILHKDVSISELRSVPLRLDQLLHHMLAKDREERLGTAGLVAEELAAIERELPEEVLAAPAAAAGDVLDATRVMPSRSMATPPPPPPTAPTGPAMVRPASGGLGGISPPPPFPTSPTPPPTSSLGSGAVATAAGLATPASSAVGGTVYPPTAGLAVPLEVPRAAAGGVAPPPPPVAMAAGAPSRSSSSGKIWLLLGGLLLVFCIVVAAGGYWFWTRYLHPQGADGAQAAAGVPSGTAPDSGAANPSHLTGQPSLAQLGQSGTAGQAATQTAADAATAATPATNAGKPGSSATPGNPGSSANAGNPAAAGNGAAGPFGQPANSAGPFGAGASPPSAPANPGNSGYRPGSGGSSTAPAAPNAPGASGRQAGSTAAAGRYPNNQGVPVAPQPPKSNGVPSSSDGAFGGGREGAAGGGRPPIPESGAGPSESGRGTTRSSRAAARAAEAAGTNADEEIADITVSAPTIAADRVLHSGLELAFRVTPPDAYVLLDGAVIGRAEEWNGQKGARSFTLPGTGSHLIKIKKGGMKEYRIAVEASATRGVTPVFVNLQPLPSANVEVADLETFHVREAIALRVQPDVAAVVMVDGSTAGPVQRFGGRFGHGDEWLSLPFGMHRVTLVAPSFKRKDLAIDVSPGADKARQKIEVSLVPETGH